MFGALAVFAMLATQARVSPTVCWNLAWTAAAVSAFTGALLGRTRARSERTGGVGRCGSAAGGCWLVGQLAWDLFAVVGLPASPNVADVGYWGFAVSVIVSMLRVPGHSRALHAVTVAETLPLIAAATALTFAELWLAAAHSSLPLPARLSALAYPAVYVSAAILVLQAIVGVSETQPIDGVAARARRDHRSSGRVHPLEPAAVGSELCDRRVGARSAVGARVARIGGGGVLAAHRPEAVIAVGEPSRRGRHSPGIMFVVLIGALVHAWLSGAPTGAGITLVVGLSLCGVSLTRSRCAARAPDAQRCSAESAELGWTLSIARPSWQG